MSRVTAFYLFFFFFGFVVSTFGIFVWTFSNILFEYFFGLFRRRTNDRQNTNARNTNSGRVENGGEDGEGGTTTVENHKTGILQVIFSSFNRTRNKKNNKNKIEVKCTVTLELLIPVLFRSTLFPPSLPPLHHYLQ